MFGAIKRRLKSNKKVKGIQSSLTSEQPSPRPFVDDNLHKGTKPPSPRSLCVEKVGLTQLSPHKSGGLPTVEFIHVNSGRIELHPGAKRDIRWPGHLIHQDTRHSWCGSSFTGGNDPKQPRKDIQLIQERLGALERLTTEFPQLQPIVKQLGDDVLRTLTLQHQFTTDLQSLHSRVHALETHNRALVTIVLPALMKLVKEKPNLPPPAKPKTQLRAIANPNPSQNAAITKSPLKKPEPQVETKAITARNRKSEECRIPRITNTRSPLPLAHTHPPKCPSNSKNQVTTITTTIPTNISPQSNPKEKRSSKLPVRKSINGRSKVQTSETKAPTSAQAVRNVTTAKNTTNSAQTTKNETRTTKEQGTRDEGYSTMSSEALAEQELQLTNLNNLNSKLKQNPEKSKSKTTTSTDTDKSKSLHRSNTFTSSGPLKYSSPSTNCNSNSLPITSNERTVATAAVLQPASITTTSDNVRIVHGTPYEIKFRPELTSTVNTDGDESSGTVLLWEDSDDSDILFLPIEVSSSGSGSESTSTLVPCSRSSYASWTTPTPTASTSKHNSSYEEDEQVLMEKWMLLEDVRNEETTWEEEWAWDWDGVLQLKYGRHKPLKLPNISNELLLFDSPKSEKVESIVATDTKEVKEIDSRTWTKSTKKRMELVDVEFEDKGQPEDLEEGGIIPTTTEFTAEFYRLTSCGTEEKMIQTETWSSTDNLSLSSTDLFVQCRSCLDEISKLTIGGDLDVDTASTSDFGKDGVSSTWLPVPQGLLSSQADVERILELLSSSESEETFSPSK